jgi:hypothetical protein
MNRKYLTRLAIAAILVALPSAGFAQEGSVQSGPDSQTTQAASDANQQASRMVPATAVFITDIDSRKMAAGATFQAKLEDKVRLEGGPELPAGTVLIGQIVNDGTQASGTAKLALQFTAARLKNGQDVPIKATIFNVFNATDDDSAATASSLRWNRGALGVDQVDAVSGVDLHSSIASPNSGIFVSTKKDDIKLSRNIGVDLAIAPSAAGTQQTAGSN